VQMAAEVFAALKQQLNDRELPTTVGDEGGFAPPVAGNLDMLDLLIDAFKAANYEPGRDIVFALDVAASEFHEYNIYLLST